MHKTRTDELLRFPDACFEDFVSHLAGIGRTRDIFDGIFDHRLDVLAAIDSVAIPMCF